MITKKPTLKLIYLAVTILLVLSFNDVVKASEVAPDAEDTEDLEGIEELLAVDEEVEKEAEGGNGVKSSEADVLTKAQRIVIELNNDNTKRVIDGFEFVLVLGYAPWCPRSAELMPQFAEAATSLKESGSPLQMAKLDADRYPKSASFLGIKGFPTMLLFVNGSSQLYSGGFTTDDIVLWTRKKTGTPVIRISSVAEAEEFLKKYHAFVIGLFDKFEGPHYEEFVKAAKSDNETQFVEVNKAELAKVLFPDLKHSDLFLGIVKSEPERYTAYDGTFSVDKILEFLDYNKFPLVTKLTEMNSMRIYSSPVKLQVYVFSDIDDFKNLLEPLQDVARTFKSKVMFIHVDINNENLAKPFLTLLGLEESKQTVIAAFENGGTSKFLLESKPTRSNIEEFCNKLVDGSLSLYFKSQPIPDNTNASVHAVVGKTFDDIVLSSDKSVLLEVFTPWCIKCETTTKHVEKLAKHYKGSSNLIFARIDASANEHPKLQVNDYPTLLLYKASDKTKPIKLSTKSSLKELAASINKHLKVKDQTVKDEL
ncbi:protein disulfide isomerase-like 1-6 [Neltuma alba]|uniref:protein disulfide isomerase-like 1-6 n=1 Tax=Neltuma alba TaxID=207710 RepID=UPI0010A51C2C|nr:protein disulfide isomerase-like 1-6 [Prosopis alba]